VSRPGLEREDQANGADPSDKQPRDAADECSRYDGDRGSDDRDADSVGQDVVPEEHCKAENERRRPGRDHAAEHRAEDPRTVIPTIPEEPNPDPNWDRDDSQGRQQEQGFGPSDCLHEPQQHSERCD
jgi:hypothetical protein